MSQLNWKMHPPLLNRVMLATASGQVLSPSNAILAVPSGGPQGVVTYVQEAASVPLSPSTIQPEGGSQPHYNMQPYLCINFIISLFGVFPSQT